MDFSKTRKSPILLQEISRKYALDPLRPIRGFVKLENNADKGLVTVIVENVKFFLPVSTATSCFWPESKKNSRSTICLEVSSCLQAGEARGPFASGRRI